MAWGSSTGQSRFFIFAQTADGSVLHCPASMMGSSLKTDTVDEGDKFSSTRLSSPPTPSSAIDDQIAKRLRAARQEHAGVDLPLTDTAIVIHFDRA